MSWFRPPDNESEVTIVTDTPDPWQTSATASPRPDRARADPDDAGHSLEPAADSGRHASPADPVGPVAPSSPVDSTHHAAAVDTAEAVVTPHAGQKTPDRPPPEPTPAETAPAAETASMQALVDAVRTLTEALDASWAAQEHQRRLLDKLHEERQQLREAEQRRLRDPVLRELIQLSDTCVRNSRQWRERSDVTPETAEKVSAVLLEAADDVRLTLERQGVEGFSPLQAEKFDRSEAKAVDSRPTVDPTQDGLVAEVRKPGYRLGDRVLRFSEVVVWRVASTPDATHHDSE